MTSGAPCYGASKNLSNFTLVSSTLKPSLVGYLNNIQAILKQLLQSVGAIFFRVSMKSILVAFVASAAVVG